jgi:hypothetical protein
MSCAGIPNFDSGGPDRESGQPPGKVRPGGHFLLLTANYSVATK